jgi:hypothetical protein
MVKAGLHTVFEVIPEDTELIPVRPKHCEERSLVKRGFGEHGISVVQSVA